MHYISQVQLLVENNKNLDFKEALELAADVQPIKVNPQVIDEVSPFILYIFCYRHSHLFFGLRADDHRF